MLSALTAREKATLKVALLQFGEVFSLPGCGAFERWESHFGGETPLTEREIWAMLTELDELQGVQVATGDDLLCLAEIAKLVSKTNAATAKALIEQGVVPIYKYGRTVRIYKKADLQKVDWAQVQDG